MESLLAFKFTSSLPFYLIFHVIILLILTVGMVYEQERVQVYNRMKKKQIETRMNTKLNKNGSTL